MLQLQTASLKKDLRVLIKPLPFLIVEENGE